MKTANPMIGYQHEAWLSEDVKDFKSMKLTAQAELASLWLLWISTGHLAYKEVI